MRVTKIYNILMLLQLRVSQDLRDCNSFNLKWPWWHCILGIIHRDSSDYLNILQNSYPGSGKNISVMSPGPSWLYYLWGNMCVYPLGKEKCQCLKLMATLSRHWLQNHKCQFDSTLSERIAVFMPDESNWAFWHFSSHRNVT